ncbi:MAG: class D sortase [Chloroflexi bacterium]|nr:class D sortase [Chloroflexota bacterium]
MSDRKADDLSVKELEQLLYHKKRQQRLQRLERLQQDGRLVVVDGLAAPNPNPPPLPRPEVSPTGAMRYYVLNPEEGELIEPEPTQRRINWRWVSNKFLLFVEIGAVIGLLVVLVGLWLTRQELNQELIQAQQAQVAEIALPTPTATPIIGLVVLPSGHRPPISGRPPEAGEAGDIPAHLMPAINAYVPPPIPTPGPEQARRIEIPAIGVDSTIVQGVDWDQLKKGVGQHINAAQPGREGNLVLAAHNDIFGEIFRHLDKLTPGDEIIISTERQSYTYVVREIDVVAPTAVSVMDPTAYAQATLISCYPYQINTQRIVVFADLIADANSS